LAPSGCLDSFGDEYAADFIPEMDDPRDHRLAHRIAVDPTNETDVELPDARSQLDDVPEAGIAGTRVIDGQLDQRSRIMKSARIFS